MPALFVLFIMIYDFTCILLVLWFNRCASSCNCDDVFLHWLVFILLVYYALWLTLSLLLLRVLLQFQFSHCISSHDVMWWCVCLMMPILFVYYALWLVVIVYWCQICLFVCLLRFMSYCIVFFFFFFNHCISSCIYDDMFVYWCPLFLLVSSSSSLLHF